MSGHSQLSFRGLLFGPVVVRCVCRSVLDVVSHVTCSLRFTCQSCDLCSMFDTVVFDIFPKSVSLSKR